MKKQKNRLFFCADGFAEISFIKLWAYISQRVYR